MDRANTADYQLIKANDAVKGRKYFCPICNGELHFYPGTKNTPHFRHGKGVPKEVKDTCELYSQNLGDYSLYDQEFAARNRVRLVLDKQNNEYLFKLKFPLIQQSSVRMQHNDMYFTYYCEQLQDFQLNTVHLLPARKSCEIVAPLISRYNFYCTNHQYEKMLGLHISGIFEPFIDGPLIFKEIQGEFISIPYRRLTLSGRFFIVSTGPLTYIHSDIEVINIYHQKHNYIYELITPIVFSDDLQNWLTRIVGYTLLASTCHLDIVKPVSFKKIGTTIELNCDKSSWLVTSIGLRHVEQRLILIKPNHHRQVFKVPSNSIVELKLPEPGDYLLYVDQEVTEMLTLRYNPKLEYYSNFKGQVTINNTDALFKIRKLRTEQIKLETDLSIVVHTENDVNYEIKHGGKHFFSAPIRIDFPTLWSIEVQKPLVFSNNISIGDILRVYEKYHFYPKVICTIKELQMLQYTVIKSNFIYKDKILYFIRRFGLHLPKPIGEIIKELKHAK